jgi:putative aldouronate transport system permease protein
MGILTVVFLYPLLNVLAISVSGNVPILQNRITFYPMDFNLNAYEDVLQNASIWRAYWNTIQVAFWGCITTVFMTCLAAYPLAYCEFYGKKLYNYMIIFTLWFGGGLIPTYIVMNNLGLTNRLSGLVVLSLLSAFYVIVIKSFFLTIPHSLIESAKLDGANDFLILFRIVMPLSKAALATIALWTVVGHWNSFIGPLVYLRDKNLFTLQIILRDIVLQSAGAAYGLQSADAIGQGGPDDTIRTIPEQVQNAVIFASMIPMLMIYPFLQRYFVKGIMIGSVKG